MITDLLYSGSRKALRTVAPMGATLVTVVNILPKISKKIGVLIRMDKYRHFSSIFCSKHLFSIHNYSTEEHPSCLEMVSTAAPITALTTSLFRASEMLRRQVASFMKTLVPGQADTQHKCQDWNTTENLLRPS